jgi:hypothetical protein
MVKEDSFIDLLTYREQKQLQGEKNAAKLLELASDFAVRYANIREKVRAKHLFRQQILFSSELPLPKYLDDIFQQWFLFDYHTIQGETMFSLFLKQHAAKLSEPELVLGALFLTTFVEPFKIIEMDEEQLRLEVRDLSNGRSYSIKISITSSSHLKSGKYVFLRRLPLITNDWSIGPIFPTDELIHPITESYEQACKVNPSLTWRSFLKRTGYILLAQNRSR